MAWRSGQRSGPSGTGVRGQNEVEEGSEVGIKWRGGHSLWPLPLAGGQASNARQRSRFRSCLRATVLLPGPSASSDDVFRQNLSCELPCEKTKEIGLAGP
eukprot:3191542-Rhodomonas_salina.1